MTERNNRRAFMGGSAALLASAPLAMADTPVPADAATKAAVEKAVADCRESAEAAQVEDLAVFGKALVARFGAGVVETVRETTVARARRSMEAAPVASRDLGAVRKLLWDRMPASFAWRVVESTPERLRFEVTRCPLAEAWRRHGAPELGFAYACAYDIGFCQGLNPALRFTRTTTLMDGDKACNHTYELPDSKS